MANPAEYHSMMYEFFWNGVVPEQRQTKDGKTVAKKPVPRAAMAEFQRMLEEQQSPDRVAQRQAALEARVKRMAEQGAPQL